MRKAIAIDFDGCLCKNMWPNIGLPNFDAINAAIREKQNGTALILWTCRVGEKLENAIQFCKNYGLEFDAVNDNLPERIAFYEANPRKVNADEYWDDLSVFVSAATPENVDRPGGYPGDATVEIIKPLPDDENMSLEPCPFCGGAEVVYEKYQHDARERWRCWCTNCLASVDPGWAQDLHVVRDMWNRCAVSSDAPLTLEELRKMDGKPILLETGEVSIREQLVAEWEILTEHADDVFFFTRRERGFSAKNYRRTWLAYRRKPKEG